MPGPAHIPVLSRLLSEGTLFEETIAAGSHTPPSFASILTGREPFIHGVHELRSRLGHDLPVLPEILGQHGYHSVGELTGPLFPETGMLRGFTEGRWRPPGEHLGAAWGERLRRSLRDGAFPRPWFVFLHLFELHWPRRVPLRSHRDRYGRTRYDRALSALDDQIGRLIESLPPGTIIVLTADHGERLDTAYDRVEPAVLLGAALGRLLWRSFQGFVAPRLPRGLRARADVRHAFGFGDPLHGADVHECLIRVPWLLHGPGVPQGLRVAGQVRHVDIAPTLLDLLGLPRPAWMQPSLMPELVAGRVADRPAYAEGWAGLKGSGAARPTCLRSGGYKCVRDSFDAAVPERLFDVRSDPEERSDLAQRQPERARAMREHLRDMLNTESADDRPPLPQEDDRRVLRRLRELGYLEDA